MSKSTSIDLRITHRDSQEVASPLTIIKKFDEYGWNIFYHNCTRYLPLHDKDMFDWQVKTIAKSELYNLIEKKEALNELVGIMVQWGNTHITAAILLYTQKKLIQSNIFYNVLFCIDASRKTFMENDIFEITDVNWYLEKILPIFRNGSLMVEHYTYQENL